MTTLQGYISYNLTPASETGNIALATLDTMRSIIYEAGLETALEGTSLTVKVTASAAVAAPFCIINIVKKVSEGESVFEATITTVSSTGTGILATALFTLAFSEVTIPVAIAAGIFGGVVAYYSDKTYEKWYEGGSQNTTDNAINLINSVGFSVDENEYINVTGTVSTSNGLLANDLANLLSTINENNITFGNITIDSDYINYSDMLPLITALKEIASTQIEVISPAGNHYIEQLSSESSIITGEGYSDTLIGGAGANVILGNTGADEIYGGADNDTIYGCDTLANSIDDKNELYGEAGNDYIIGGNNNDYIDGGIGDDVIVAGTANNVIFGNEGNVIFLTKHKYSKVA